MLMVCWQPAVMLQHVFALNNSRQGALPAQASRDPSQRLRPGTAQAAQHSTAEAESEQSGQVRPVEHAVYSV
jgi:hypothetical protein